MSSRMRKRSDITGLTSSASASVSRKGSMRSSSSSPSSLYQLSMGMPLSTCAQGGHADQSMHCSSSAPHRFCHSVPSLCQDLLPRWGCCCPLAYTKAHREPPSTRMLLSNCSHGGMQGGLCVIPVPRYLEFMSCINLGGGYVDTTTVSNQDDGAHLCAGDRNNGLYD
eukprot:1156188-Pelagomonas_calceolata.AAC.3